MATGSCVDATTRVPTTLLLPGPLQNVEMATRSCATACGLVPTAKAAPGPFQDVEVTTRSCTTACGRVPNVSSFSQLLKELKLSISGRVGTLAFPLSVREVSKWEIHVHSFARLLFRW